MKTVMVTGAGGFIGQHTARALADRGYDVVAVDWHRWRLDELKGSDRVFLLHGDIRSEIRMAEVFDQTQPEAVIHLAAQSTVVNSWKNPKVDAMQNIIGTLNIIAFCQRYGVKRIVYAASGGTVYGEMDTLALEGDPLAPQSPYGVSKLAGEFYVRLSGISHAILRYSNVYGSGQASDGPAGVIAIFAASILLDKPCIIYGDGLNTRDYVFITDVVAANIAALESDASGVFNIGTGIATSITEVLEAVAAATGKEPIVGCQPGRPGDIRHSVLDSQKARREFNWRPKESFTDGVAMTVEAMTRGGQTVSRRLHGPEKLGSIPSRATKEESHAL